MKWVKFQRQALIPLVSALVGALIILFLEWVFFNPRGVRTPVIVSVPPSEPSTSNLGPYELQARIRVNPCVDLKSYVCAIKETEDPTGQVGNETEGEIAALRIYENVSKSKWRISKKEVEEEVVRQIYSKERVARIRSLFFNVQQQLIKLIETRPDDEIPHEEKTILISRIESVALELPPPAHLYEDDTDLFTRPNIYYERINSGKRRVRIGGAILLSVQSEFNLTFTLAHEIAHAIDPCEMKVDGYDFLFYRQWGKCVGSIDRDYECSNQGKLSELFADWMATNITSRKLRSVIGRYKSTELKAALINSVKDLCNGEGPDLTHRSDSLSSAHPNASYRVNQIFGRHPLIQTILGCSKSPSSAIKRCFWN